jgi:hypothetical protein
MEVHNVIMERKTLLAVSLDCVSVAVTWGR